MNDLIYELQSKVERLESEISFKNGLISILSHNSKSMFSSLLWLIDALEENTISEEDFFKLLPQVKTDAQQNLQTVQDSTEWLKTQYGEFILRPEKMPVVELFNELKEKYAGSLAEKNLSFRYSGNFNAHVESDRILLGYVLDKILNNAVKYSLTDQDIVLEARTEGTHIILSVTDSGTGMDKNFLEKIYSYENPVYQGTAGETGVGLSLKIVKNFVSLMNGNIEIISSEGKGTKVKLYVPKL